MQVTRRSVLKSLAIAAMCPTIRLRPAVPDERLLLAFCDSDAWRYDFTKPFGVDSLTFATDSRAMVRCELASRQEDGERRLPGNVLAVWDFHWQPGQQWRSLEPNDLRPTLNNIDGRDDDLCPECDGKATISCGENYPGSIEERAALDKFGYDVDTNCIRDKSCPTCHGLDYMGPSLVKICGVRHSAYRLKRILALPNVRVCQSQFRPDTLLFRADGFEGVSLGHA